MGIQTAAALELCQANRLLWLTPPLPHLPFSRAGHEKGMNHAFLKTDWAESFATNPFFKPTIQIMMKSPSRIDLQSTPSGSHRRRRCVSLVLLLLFTAMALPSVDANTSLKDFSEQAEGSDWTNALQSAIHRTPEGETLEVPAGEYRISAPIQIEKSITLRFESGARLVGNVSELFRILGGENIVFKGMGGHPALINHLNQAPELDERGIPRGRLSSVISLNHIRDGEEPAVRIQGLYLEGFRCINGFPEDRQYTDESPPLRALEVLDCRIEAGDMHIAHRQSRIDRLIIENSYFTGSARFGIWITSPLPDGASIRGNILKDVGIRAIQLGGGAANMIDDGAVEHVPSAIVHDNQVLGGGQGARFETSYIMGILVYGNNISIQGNVVRDFNRGEPVPGEPYGQHIPLDDGTYYRGVWRTPDGRDDRVRVAGAALYAKARSGIIANNICTNSGWRSVIEVKTGGREPHVLVTGNVVDGSSLAIEDSFGFEPSSGQSIWSNNLVYNMPVMAFRVRAGHENVYLNNVIHNAKVGFEVRGSGSRLPEVIEGNPMFNVATPYLIHEGAETGADISPGGNLIVPAVGSLPSPSERYLGRIALIQEPDEDLIYICRQDGDVFMWAPVVAGGSVGEAIFDRRNLNWVEVSDNLALNPDQSDDTNIDRSAAASRQAYGEFPFGWTGNIGGDHLEWDLVAAYDEELFETGARSLRIGDWPEVFNFQLAQVLTVSPGLVYRVRANLRKTNERTRVTLILDSGDLELSQPLEAVDQWEVVEELITIPEDSNQLRVRIWCGRAGDNGLVYIDSIEVHVVEEETRQAGGFFDGR